MDQLFVKFIEHLTVLDAGLTVCVIFLWKDNVKSREKLIEIFEKVIETKVDTIEVLNQIEKAIDVNTREIERIRNRS